MDSSKVTAVLELIGKQCTPPLAAADIERQHVLADLGIDSLKFMMLVIEIEDCIGRPMFKADEVGAVSTIGDILDQLERG